jgi:hypothetical protein
LSEGGGATHSEGGRGNEDAIHDNHPICSKDAQTEQSIGKIVPVFTSVPVSQRGISSLIAGAMVGDDTTLDPLKSDLLHTCSACVSTLASHENPSTQCRLNFL